MQKIDWTLLKKSVTEDLSSKESAILKSWLEASEIHREFYGKLSCFLTKKNRGEVDVEKNFHLFMQKVGREKRWSVTFCLRYAAMVVCVLGAALFIYFRHSVPTELAPENSIVIGSSRAVLHTAGGKIIPLEQTVEKQIMESTGFRLIQKQNRVSYDMLDTMAALPESHLLEVPHGGEFQLCLSDGTYVYMNAESRLKYPVMFTGTERRVSLSGEAYFQVTKSRKPFIIELDGVEIKVLGTEFNVRAYEDEGCFLTTLVNGKVEVSSNGRKVDLFPGEQAVYGKGNLSKKRVDVIKYIAWKEGFVAFEDERLEDIMNKLGRWYNIEVFYTEKGLKDIQFTGNINRYGDIRVLLNKIEKLDVIRFQVKGNCITVTAK